MLHVVWIGIVLLILYSNYYIISGTSDHIYRSVDSVPRNRVGLVLGTSRYLRSGGSNPYFRYRIDAAIKLYNADKIEYILVSGDNSLKSYNEPKLMREALEERGVPGNRIFADYAGFRTLDSVVRSKEVFGQETLTIITQEFHGGRAVFIGRHKGIDAVAYAAGSVPTEFGFKVLVREVFARVKAVLDIYIFHTQPRFLGEAEIIPD
ncbi:MAG TPA: ElyC/SanA/YdcF family protein [Clostridia bacterium]|nr:ElyC/SanA/YdcF family protein [Clostridia bacterium]